MRIWKKFAAVTFLICACSITASAGTFYIDYSNGSDSNNGGSKSTPWKKCPGMSGFSGSYSHAPGDRFILKGGVTWTSECFPMTLTSGNSTNPDYYGVDQTWFASSSWRRPIFDRQGAATHTLITGNDYVNIDNIEVTGFYWNASTGGFGTTMILMGKHVGMTVSNCYFHNWNHDSFGSGCKDDLQIILGSTSGPGAGSVIVGCTFDGAPNGTSSGMAVYCASIIRNSTARNMTNGFLPFAQAGSLEVSGCEVGPINWSFDSAMHPNSIEAVSGGTFNIHHNKIHDATAVCIFVGTGSGNVANIYNNVIWNSSPIPIQFDGRTGGNNTAFVYNNTIIDANNRGVINNAVGTPFTVTARNNHVIGGSISPNTSNNLVQSVAAAVASNYTIDGLWAPKSNLSPTVDKGTNPASFVVDDFVHTSRPQGAGWDIGAFEYRSGAPVPTATPTPSPTIAPGPSATPSPTPNPTPTPTPAGSSFSATIGAITSPFAVNGDDTISQAVQTTDPMQGGKAVYNFAITDAGDYAIGVNVNAPSVGNNSFFVNVDADPIAPDMIWDVPVTTGLERRIVSWRGNGTDVADQFSPKVFTLSAGTHQLVIVGRETGVSFQSITFSKMPAPPANLHVTGP